MPQTSEMAVRDLKVARAPANASWISVQAGCFRWIVNPQFAPKEFLARLAAPELLIAPPAEPLRRSPRPNKVVRVALPEFPGAPLIVKQYPRSRLWRSMKSLFRESRPRRAFKSSFVLAKLNIPTATPVAAGERRVGRCVRDAYLIAAQVNDALDLREFRKQSGAPAFRRAIRQLGVILARLHDAGWSHTDPTLSNFLVQRKGTNEEQLVLIDTDAIRRVRFCSARFVVKELRLFLRRIPMTQRDILWFLAEYCRARHDCHSSRELRQALQPFPKPIEE